VKAWIPLIAVGLAMSPLAVVHPVRVSGMSMHPALADGELRWVLRRWASHAPARGEIWLVEGPLGSSVKRVVGLPGDQVRWHGPDLWVNDQPWTEPWVEHPERRGEGSRVCGNGYLVLGDNRPESQDSRSWGPLPLGAMRGRVL